MTNLFSINSIFKPKNTLMLSQQGNFQSISPLVVLAPLPEVECPIFLEIQNPWGKVIKRSGLTFEHFCMEVV